MLGFTILMLVNGLGSPLVGKVIDQHGVRSMLTVGAFSYLVSFLMLSRLQSLWMYYAAYGVMAISAAATGPVVCSTLVSYWFNKKRGLAIGIMSASAGAGSLVISLLVGGWMLPNFGWRNSYLFMGITGAVIVMLLNGFVVKTKPSDVGLFPDGAKPSAAEANAGKSQPKPKGLTQKQALRTWTFWLIGIALLLFSIPLVGVLQNQVPHLNDLGFKMTLAAGALGVVGLMGGVSKFIFGWLCDFIHVKLATVIGFSLQLIALIIITYVINKNSSVPTLYAYAVIFGLGAGCWMPLMAMLASNYFGLLAFGSILGFFMLFQQLGSAVGPLVAGILYDKMGSYSTVFVAFIVMCLLSIACISMVRNTKLFQAE